MLPPSQAGWCALGISREALHNHKYPKLLEGLLTSWMTSMGHIQEKPKPSPISKGTRSWATTHNSPSRQMWITQEISQVYLNTWLHLQWSNLSYWRQLCSMDYHHLHTMPDSNRKTYQWVLCIPNKNLRLMISHRLCRSIPIPGLLLSWNQSMKANPPLSSN